MGKGKSISTFTFTVKLVTTNPSPILEYISAHCGTTHAQKKTTRVTATLRTFRKSPGMQISPGECRGEPRRQGPPRLSHTGTVGSQVTTSDTMKKLLPTVKWTVKRHRKRVTNGIRDKRWDEGSRGSVMLTIANQPGW